MSVHKPSRGGARAELANMKTARSQEAGEAVYECLGGGTGGAEPMGVSGEGGSKEKRWQIANGGARAKWNFQRAV